MQRWRLLLPLFVFIGAFAFRCVGADFTKEIRPLISEYCLKCHSTEKQKGDLDLERFASHTEVIKHPKIWQAVVEQLTLGEMPPKDKPQPAPQQRDLLLAWA